jgi:hypothetical protein
MNHSRTALHRPCAYCEVLPSVSISAAYLSLYKPAYGVAVASYHLVPSCSALHEKLSWINRDANQGHCLEERTSGGLEVLAPAPVLLLHSISCKLTRRLTFGFPLAYEIQETARHVSCKVVGDETKRKFYQLPERRRG